MVKMKQQKTDTHSTCPLCKFIYMNFLRFPFFQRLAFPLPAYFTHMRIWDIFAIRTT